MNKTSLRLVDSDMDALVPLREAAELLGLDVSTIRKRSAGTAGLTVVRQGRSCFLCVAKSLPTVGKLIDDARRQNDVLKLLHR